MLVGLYESEEKKIRPVFPHTLLYTSLQSGSFLSCILSNRAVRVKKLFLVRFYETERSQTSDLQPQLRRSVNDLESNNYMNSV